MRTKQNVAKMSDAEGLLWLLIAALSVVDFWGGVAWLWMHNEHLLAVGVPAVTGLLVVCLLFLDTAGEGKEPTIPAA